MGSVYTLSAYSADWLVAVGWNEQLSTFWATVTQQELVQQMESLQSEIAEKGPSDAQWQQLALLEFQAVRLKVGTTVGEIPTLEILEHTLQKYAKLDPMIRNQLLDDYNTLPA